MDCPKDYAPDLPLRRCGELVPQLYTVTNKKIPVYGIKYVPYKQDNFRILIPCYVCDVKCPILSASRLLDRGYGLDFNPRHHHHSHTKDCDRSLVEAQTTGNLMVATPSEFTNDHAKHFLHHATLDDWRLTIINRQGQEQEQLQENPTQLSKQGLQRRLEGDSWTGETRFRRKITPTRGATSGAHNRTQPKATIHRPLAAQEDNQDYW